MRLRIKRIIAFFIVIVITTTFTSNGVSAKAKIRLNHTSVTLKVGNKATLKLKNAKGKIVFKSKNNSIASVTKKGVIKAKSAGTTKVLVKHKKKSYKCIVNVIDSIVDASTSSPYYNRKMIKEYVLANGLYDLTNQTYSLSYMSGTDIMVSIVYNNANDTLQLSCFQKEFQSSTYSKAYTSFDITPTGITDVGFSMYTYNYYNKPMYMGMLSCKNQSVSSISINKNYDWKVLMNTGTDFFEYIEDADLKSMGDSAAGAAFSMIDLCLQTRMKGITSSMKAIGFSDTKSNNSNAPSSTQVIPAKPNASENASSIEQTGTTQVKVTTEAITTTEAATTTEVIHTSFVELSSAMESMKQGDVLHLNAIQYPENSVDEIVWSSSNEKIAVVENGTVTALKPGNVEIYAKSGNYTAKCSVIIMVDYADIVNVEQKDNSQILVTFDHDVRKTLDVDSLKIKRVEDNWNIGVSSSTFLNDGKTICIKSSPVFYEGKDYIVSYYDSNYRFTAEIPMEVKRIVINTDNQVYINQKTYIDYTMYDSNDVVIPRLIYGDKVTVEVSGDAEAHLNEKSPYFYIRKVGNQAEITVKYNEGESGEIIETKTIRGVKIYIG